jgi:hypothetical protein
MYSLMMMFFFLHPEINPRAQMVVDQVVVVVLVWV